MPLTWRIYTPEYCLCHCSTKNECCKYDLNKSCVTYWLNKLQNLKTQKDYFLTLNPIAKIDKSKIIKKVEFTHPFYDMKTVKAQKYLSELQGVNNSWFCGSYFGYGFHEDGLNSGIDVSKKLWAYLIHVYIRDL